MFLRPVFVVVVIAVLALRVPAQPAPIATTTPSTPSAAGPAESPGAQARKSAWSFSLAAYTYFVPDHADYVQPTITADHVS